MTSSIVAMLLGTITGIVAYEIGQDLADELSFGTIGMSSVFDFDEFLRGVELFQQGAYAAGEAALVAATIGIMKSVDDAFNAEKDIGAIMAKYIKGAVRQTPMPPGGPDWDEILRKTWEAVKKAAQTGERWAKTLKKELCKPENWKKDPRQ